jgi:hypothetical protein
VGVVKRRVLRGLWRRLVGVGSYGLYTMPLAALVRPIALCAAFTLPGCVLREISGGATMTTPVGRAQHDTVHPPRCARLTGFYHRVGASSLRTWLRPFALPRYYTAIIAPPLLGKRAGVFARTLRPFIVLCSVPMP